MGPSNYQASKKPDSELLKSCYYKLNLTDPNLDNPAYFNANPLLVQVEHNKTLKSWHKQHNDRKPIMSSLSYSHLANTSTSWYYTNGNKKWGKFRNIKTTMSEKRV